MTNWPSSYTKTFMSGNEFQWVCNETGAFWMRTRCITSGAHMFGAPTFTHNGRLGKASFPCKYSQPFRSADLATWTCTPLEFVANEYHTFPTLNTAGSGKSVSTDGRSGELPGTGADSEQIPNNDIAHATQVSPIMAGIGPERQRLKIPMRLF